MSLFRVGKLNPDIFKDINIKAYGNFTPLSDLA